MLLVTPVFTTLRIDPQQTPLKIVLDERRSMFNSKCRAAKSDETIYTAPSTVTTEASPNLDVVLHYLNCKGARTCCETYNVFMRYEYTRLDFGNDSNMKANLFRDTARVSDSSGTDRFLRDLVETTQLMEEPVRPRILKCGEQTVGALCRLAMPGDCLVRSDCDFGHDPNHLVSCLVLRHYRWGCISDRWSSCSRSCLGVV